MTNIDKLWFSFGHEVPLDSGRGVHLSPHLAGNAAQLEALAGHCLCVRVHLSTGSIDQVHYTCKKQIWIPLDKDLTSNIKYT